MDRDTTLYCGVCRKTITPCIPSTIYSTTCSKVYHKQCMHRIRSLAQQQDAMLVAGLKCIVQNCIHNTLRSDWFCRHCIAHLEKGLYRAVLSTETKGIPLSSLGDTLVKLYTVPYWLRDMYIAVRQTHPVMQWLQSRMLQHLQSKWQYTFTSTSIYSTAYSIVTDIIHRTPTIIETDTNFHTLPTVNTLCEKGVDLAKIIHYFKDFCSTFKGKKKTPLQIISRTAFRGSTAHNIYNQSTLHKKLFAAGVYGCSATSLYTEYEQAFEDVHTLEHGRQCIITPDGNTVLIRRRKHDPIKGLRAAWKRPKTI